MQLDFGARNRKAVIAGFQICLKTFGGIGVLKIFFGGEGNQPIKAQKNHSANTIVETKNLTREMFLLSTYDEFQVFLPWVEVIHWENIILHILARYATKRINTSP